MAPSLHQTLLMVSDLDASTAFYRDYIDLEPDVVDDGNVEFATGECTLVLEDDFEEDVLEDFGLDAPTSPRGDGVIVAISVDDRETVESTVDRVAEAGYDVNMPPREVPWGRLMALVTDPDGYVVEISTAI